MGNEPFDLPPRLPPGAPPPPPAAPAPTSSSSPAGEAPPRVYVAAKRVGWQAAGFIAGGTLFLLALVFQFILLLAVKPSRGGASDHMPGVIGGLSVLGIGLIARGVFLLRSVVRAVLDEHGLSLEGFISRTWVPWANVLTMRRDKKGQLLGESVAVLTLLDAAGRMLARVPESLGGFDDLAREIAERSAAAHGRVTFDADADAVRQQRVEAKKLRWTAVLAGVMAVAFGAIFAGGLNETIHLRRYATEGTFADATIVRRYMVRVTPRLEYEFTDTAGRTHRREAMMEQAAWDALEGQQQVLVEYLTSDPSWNRPAFGEQKGSSLGGPFLFLSGGLTVFMVAMSTMALFGFDVKSEGGVLKVTRRGRVLKSFGTPAPQPPLPGMPPPSGIVPPRLPSGQPTSIVPPPPTFPPAGFQSGASTPPQPFAPRSQWNAWQAPPSQLSAPRRPGGLVALGILAIMLGLGGLLLGVVRVVVSRLDSIPVGNEQEIVLDVPRWATWWAAADGALAGGLLLAGVALLAMWRWSRPLGIGVSIAQIVSGVAGLVMVVVSMLQLPPPDGPESAPIIAGSAGAIVLQLLGLIFPAVLLAILAKRSTADAIAAHAVSSPTATSFGRRTTDH